MRNMVTLFVCLAAINGFSQSPASSTTGAIYLPAKLINGRFYLQIITASGDTVMSFCDTGGGYTALYQATVKRLHMESKVTEVSIDGEKTRYIAAREVITNPDIPLPFIQKYYQQSIRAPFFEVPENNKEADFMATYIPQDAFLGQFFFIEHAWTFDYLSGRLSINTPIQADAHDPNIQKLGFKRNPDGSKRFGHSSMKIMIDGQLIDVLFDTGASILLSKNTQEQLHNNSKSIGGSFIAKSLFEKWHSEHPDWRYIEKGEITGANMIQVPQVTIGTTTSGPVWFAQRPDEAWSKGMIQTMDKVVKGAVGGSLFQYYKVTIDYNSELVKFEQAK